MTKLEIGPVHLLVQNQTYAMPTRKVTCFISPIAGITVLVSNNANMVGAVILGELDFPNGQFVNSAAFLRCGDQGITLKLVADQL